MSNNTITGSLFSGNSVSATGGTALAGTVTGAGYNYYWANADGYAFGGAVYLNISDGAGTTVTDTAFLGNSAAATAGTVTDAGGTHAGTAEAHGGAIFVNTSSSNHLLTLTATGGGTTLFAGNTAGGTPNAIHFGRAGGPSAVTGYFSNSRSATLNVTPVADGNVFLYDPVTVEMYNTTAANAAFTMNMSGGGNFRWGGVNVFDAIGGSTVNITAGNTVLMSDFQLTTTPNITYRTGSATDAYTRTGVSDNPLAVSVANTNLGFDLNRNPNTAMFDFTNASAETWTFDTVNLQAFTERQLLDVNQKYLIADGITDGERDNSTSSGLALDQTQANQLWTDTVNYASPYQAAIRRNRNTESASAALNRIMNNYVLVSDAQFLLITQNLNAVTPEYALTQADVLMRTTWKIADWAAYDGFQLPERQRTYHPLVRGQIPNDRTRTWGGYVGDFANYDSYGRLQGYDSNMNGLLVGADKTWGTSSLGLYFGDTRTETDFDGLDSRAKSDGFHFGLLGRKYWTRHFSSTLDLGYAHYNNDGYRGLGGVCFAKSDFNSDAFTSGLGFEWDLTDRSRTVGITPYARLRYAHYSQDGFSEYSPGCTAADVSDLSGDSFQSVLGMEFSRQYRGLTPSLRVAWRHEYGDAGFSTLGVYQAAPDMPFALNSLGRDRDALDFGLGLRTRLGSWGTNFGYNLEAAEHLIAHGVYAGLERRW